MIRVAVDTQIAEASRAGIGQYTSDLAAALARRPDLTVIQVAPAGRTRDFSMPERWWWDQVTLPRLAARAGAEVILKPGFSTPIRSARPVVTVLHDLAARRFPEQLHRPSAWFFGRFAPWTLRFARHVITISDFTRQEAINELKLPSERLTTVHPAGDLGLQPTTDPADAGLLKRFQLPRRFILHLGTLEPRKNLAFLVRAFQKYYATHPDDALVLAGKDGWLSADIHQAIEQAGLKRHLRLLGSVTNQERRALLRAARVLAFPSLYEGFGLPPLEAMRSGLPVVAARAASIPEIVGSAGILVDRYDEEAWAEALTRACDDEAERARLRQLGLERAATFSWDRAAEQISHILHAVTHG